MDAKNYNNGLCMDIYPCMIKQAKYPLGGLKNRQNNQKVPFLDIKKKTAACVCSHNVWEQTHAAVLILDVFKGYFLIVLTVPI